MIARTYTCPGQVRELMNELEAAAAAGVTAFDQTPQDDVCVDWAPQVPGCAEPPD